MMGLKNGGLKNEKSRGAAPALPHLAVMFRSASMPVAQTSKEELGRLEPAQLNKLLNANCVNTAHAALPAGPVAYR